MLLANPMLFSTDQRHFNKAVILVTDHGPEGSRGIILNRVSPIKLKDLENVSYENSGFEVFGECVINLGGDVNEMGLTMLHQHAVPSAREVSSRFLLLAAALHVTVASSTSAAMSTRWASRCCTSTRCPPPAR